MCFEDVWVSDLSLEGKESLLEGVRLAALLSSGRAVPSRDFTGVDWERSAMAYSMYLVLTARRKL